MPKQNRTKKSTLSPLDDNLWGGKGQTGTNSWSKGERGLAWTHAGDQAHRDARLPLGRRGGGWEADMQVPGCPPARSHSAVSLWPGRFGQPLLGAGRSSPEAESSVVCPHCCPFTPLSTFSVNAGQCHPESGGAVCWGPGWQERPCLPREFRGGSLAGECTWETAWRREPRAESKQ